MNKIYRLLFILGLSFSLVRFADDEDSSDDSTPSQAEKKTSSVGNQSIDIGGTSVPESPRDN